MILLIIMISVDEGKAMMNLRNFLKQKFREVKSSIFCNFIHKTFIKKARKQNERNCAEERASLPKLGIFLQLTFSETDEVSAESRVVGVSALCVDFIDGHFWILLHEFLCVLDSEVVDELIECHAFLFSDGVRNVGTICTKQSGKSV